MKKPPGVHVKASTPPPARRRIPGDLRDFYPGDGWITEKLPARQADAYVRAAAKWAGTDAEFEQACLRRIDSPLSAILCAACTMRSRIASASVGCELREAPPEGAVAVRHAQLLEAERGRRCRAGRIGQRVDHAVQAQPAQLIERMS